MDLGLSGRTALVLGGSSGLGLAIGQVLSREGANVVLAARRGDLVRAAASAMPAALAVETDLTETGAVERVVSDSVAAFGAIDIVILNGGGPAPGQADQLETAGIERALHDLFLVNRDLVSAVLPAMRARGWGRIIAVGSSGVQQPLEALALSNIGRSALAAYLKTLAADVARDGVTVNMVLPGRFDTERVSQLDSAAAARRGSTAEEIRLGSEAAIPMGRYGRTGEFAAVVAFLASSAASYVTGEQIRCDGGMVRSY
ncbi:MAG TPA: SDR family oxidoreductase [Galbitalea sp.]|nr:SDR family oxidoreductase [Galbitalea sp.]